MSFPDVSSRVAYIYANYYGEKARENRIKSKIRNIIEAAKELVELLKLNDKRRFTVHIDGPAVFRLVQSYYLDVIKYKEYHFGSNLQEPVVLNARAFMDTIHGTEDTNKINGVRRAAFTAKWILKTRPILIEVMRLSTLSEDEKFRINTINEMLALMQAFELTKITDSIPPEDIPDTIKRDFVYHFRYRASDDRNLILQFRLLCELAESITIQKKLSAELEQLKLSINQNG